MQKYSDYQKTIIAVQGDLCPTILSPQEKRVFLDVLEGAEGDAEKALGCVDAGLSSKMRAVLEMGMRFSIEVERLEQRGVGVCFLDFDKQYDWLKAFRYNPRLLFYVGNVGLLEQSKTPVVFRLNDFINMGCRGVLIADRSIDALLRNEDVIAGIRAKNGLIVCDSAKKKANIGELKIQSTQKKKDVVKSVFISGSRSQVEISKGPQDSLKAIVDQGITVLIGDSEKGVDKEIADYLRVPLYKNVKIYTIGEDEPRINPEPAWEVVGIEANPSLGGQERQMIKDRAMASVADFGLAILRPVEKNRYGALQVSSGTLRNVIQMLMLGKPVKLFYAFEKVFLSENVKSLDSLEKILRSYETERLSAAEQAMILSCKGVSPDADPAYVKCEKIMSKYFTLLRAEKKHLSGQNETFKDDDEPIQGTLFD